MNSKVFHKEKSTMTIMTPSKKGKKTAFFQVEWTIQNIRQRMRDATWQIPMWPLVTWSRPCVGRWTFFRPQGASWSIRLQPVLFRCGCTQHALGVPRGGRFKVWFVSSKLPRVSGLLIIRVTRHCVHLFGVQRQNPSPKNSATTSFGRFYPNGLEGSKNGYCGLYVRTVSWC